MRMLGSVAIVLGLFYLIFNLFRGRKPKAEVKGSLAPIAATGRDKIT